MPLEEALERLSRTNFRWTTELFKCVRLLSSGAYNQDDSVEPNDQDEIVDEVRRARQAYAAQFDHDIRQIIEDPQTKEAQHPGVLAGKWRASVSGRE